MRNLGVIRLWRGWITSALVVVPIGAATIRQTLYYKGCMDGWGWMMFGFGAFILGGFVNLVSAVWFLAVEYEETKALPKGRKTLCLSGNILSMLVVVGQCGVCVYYLAKKASAP